MLHCTHARVERTSLPHATFPTGINPGWRRQVPKRNTRNEDGMPLDLVALSLAIWLGLLTCVTGLSRQAVPPAGLGASRAQAGALDMDVAYRMALSFGT